jgi:hypothetical protein
VVYVWQLIATVKIIILAHLKQESNNEDLYALAIALLLRGAVLLLLIS